MVSFLIIMILFHNPAPDIVLDRDCEINVW